MSTTSKSGDATRLSTLQRVADRSLVWPFKVWGFGEGIALRGLRAAHSVTNHSKYHGFVSAMLRSYVVRGVARGNEEHIAPGTELLQLYEEDCGTNGQLWARGNGWAVMGLVETLKLMPDSHPARQELRERLDRLITSPTWIKG